MFKDLDFKPVKTWPDLDSFIYFLRENPVPAVTRLLLTSGGTLTQSLKSLLLAPIHMEIVHQELADAGEGLSEFLGINESEKAYFRELWILNERKEKVVYASSLIPVKCLSPEVLQEIKMRTRLIGEILDSPGFYSQKDRMSFALGRSEKLASAFAVPEDSLFWSRKYRLSAQDHLLAEIREVFSPALFSVR